MYINIYMYINILMYINIYYVSINKYIHACIHTVLYVYTYTDCRFRHFSVGIHVYTTTHICTYTYT